MFPSHQNYNTEGRKSQSESIEVRLSSDLRQLGGIAADLDRDALDSVCHAVSPPRQGIKKAPAFQQVLNSKIYIILGEASLGLILRISLMLL